jgi:hypothetical protein
MYCFRARFELGELAALSCPDREWVLTDPDETPRVVVLPIDPGRDPELPPITMAEARTFVLRGYGYNSLDEAMADGLLWRARLMLVFAHNQVGADFGERSVVSGLFPADLADAANAGLRPIPDLLDVVAFECEPTPTFIGRSPGSARGSRAHGHLVDAMQTARKMGLALTPEQRVTYALYAASFSQPSNDARLALLMLAVETLISPAPRSAAAVSLVEELITTTRSSGLSQPEIDSIVGSLSWLRNESISRAGKRLARLVPRRFMGATESAERFFMECYSLRSRLFHGTHPLPSREEVDARATQLEVFVGDLISAVGGLPPVNLDLVTVTHIPIDERGRPIL